MRDTGVIVNEPEPIELLKYPHPYQAAFTVASDIDSGSILRFRAVHALFCGRDLIEINSPEWCALGLESSYPWFDKERGGIFGLGLDFADSFFLIGDATTFGMHRYYPKEAHFREEQQRGANCAELIRQGIKKGQIDSFHAFLHYTRSQVEGLLGEFYRWCERENVAKPTVWINHSAAVTPSGLCPDSLQPTSLQRLVRLVARNTAGPLFGRKPYPLRYAFVRYRGDTPGSPHYVNDWLAANGLRYVWLNVDDLYRDRIALPEQQQNGRATILQPITMDDGMRYWRFGRCYGAPPGRFRGGVYLRDSKEGCDASHLLRESQLEELCRVKGTCILYTHWTHFRSMPLAEETIARFHLLRHWQQAGKIWVTSTARLLEWTRQRTFLELECRRQSKRLVVNIKGLDDPLFGRQTLQITDLHGLSVRTSRPEPCVTFAIGGRPLSPEQVQRAGSYYWLNAGAAPAGRLRMRETITPANASLYESRELNE